MEKRLSNAFNISGINGLKTFIGISLIVISDQLPVPFLTPQMAVLWEGLRVVGCWVVVVGIAHKGLKLFNLRKG